MLQTRTRSLILNLSLCVLNAALLLAQKKSSSEHPARVISQSGRGTYNASCAACHGLDGHGGDKGVNISGSERVKRLSDAQLSDIISNGVPGTGMPAFRTLGPRSIRSLVGYVRSLQGKSDSQAITGDPKHGKEIFFGKGGCSGCHTISGQGGFLGPDLSTYAYSASGATVRNDITKNRRVPQQGYRAAVLTTADGDRLEGLIRNEDNFSLQFQTKDGSFHLFQKSELRSINRQETSLMPSDYSDRLSPGELNDLVSYLMFAAANAGNTAPPPKKKDEYE